MKYSEIEIGQSARLTKLLSPGLIDDFVNLTGDNNPIHIAGEIPIAHGMLIVSFISTLIGKHLPGEGALWVSHDVKFIRPIHVWEKIVIIGEVQAKDDSTKRIKLFIDVLNEKDELCIGSTAWIKVPE